MTNSLKKPSYKDRIAFGQYLNESVCPKAKKTKAADLQNLEEKKTRFNEFTEALNQAPQFLRAISNLKQDEHLGLGANFQKTLDKKMHSNHFDLKEAFTMIFTEVKKKLLKILANKKTGLKEKATRHQTKVGLMNALAIQLGWNFSSFKKSTETQANEIHQLIDTNTTALRSMLQMQFVLFRTMAIKLGVPLEFRSRDFHLLKDDKLEFIEYKSKKFLVPAVEILQETINEAKAQHKKQYDLPAQVRANSIPIGCPARKVKLEEVKLSTEFKDTKENLAIEFTDYINKIIKTIIVPRLGKLKANARAQS